MKHLRLSLLLVLCAAPSLQARASREAALKEADRLYRMALSAFESSDSQSINHVRVLGQKAQSLYQRAGDHTAEAEAAWLVASSYLDQGLHEEAAAASRGILEAARLANDPHLRAKYSAFQALLQQRQGHFEQAFMHAFEARHIYEAEQDEKGIAYVAYLLGLLHKGLGQDRSALVFLTEAIEKAVSNGEPRVEMLAAKELGAVYQSLGDNESALDYALRSLRLGTTSARGPMTYVALAIISDIKVRLRRYEEAEAYARRALEFALRLNNPNWVIAAYWRLGNCALVRGDDRAAEIYYRKCFEQPNGEASGKPLNFASIGLGRVYEKRGQLEMAVQQYEKAIDIIDGHLRARSDDEDRTSVMHQLIEPYRRAVKTLLRLHFDKESLPGEYARRAFMASERIRNRVFTEHLLSARARTGIVPQAIASKSEALERQLSDISKTLVNNHVAAGKRNALIEAMARLEIEQKAIRREVAAISQTPPLKVDEGEWPPERVRPLLPPDTAFIEYSLGDPAAAFVITRDRFEVIRLPRVNGVDSRVSAYVDLVSARQRFNRFGLAAGFELYQDLFLPVRSVLPKSISHLVIAPDGILEMLPFETLPVDRTGRFLIEDHSISYIPSASTFPMVLDWKERKNSRLLLALADPIHTTFAEQPLKQHFFEGEDFPLYPLPYTRDEIKSVVDTVGRDGSDVYTGELANEERLKSLDLSAYRVIHFATHAIASPRHPDRSALVLSQGLDQRDDGFLQVREIFNLRLNADLVVLSACQTGQGNGIMGEGIQGLSRTFFFAGARSVVASIWKVEDQATARLMARFYRHLSNGLSKADSLQRTKIDLIAQGMQPYQWAAFLLVGESNANVPFGPQPHNWLSLSAGALIFPLVLIGLAVIWLARNGRFSFVTNPAPRFLRSGREQSQSPKDPWHWDW